MTRQPASDPPHAKRPLALLLSIPLILAGCGNTTTQHTADTPLRAQHHIATTIVPGTHTAADNGSGGTALSIAKPTNLETNDVLVAQVVIVEPATNDTACPNAIASSPGWVHIRTDTVDNKVKQQIFYRVVTSSDTSLTGYTWQIRNSSTCTTSATRSAIGGIKAYRGVDTAQPVNAHGGNTGLSGSTVYAPAVTTDRTGTQLVRYFSRFKIATSTNFTSTGSFYFRSQSNGKERSILAAQSAQAAAGATTTHAATMESAEWASATVALNERTGQHVVADTQPPVVTVTFSDNWNTSGPVTGSVEVTDNVNVASLECTGATLGTITKTTTKWTAPLAINADSNGNLPQGGIQVQCTAADGQPDGTASNLDTAYIDTLAPTVTPASVISSTWRNTDLGQTFAASDAFPGSGLAVSGDASFTLTATAESADASTPTVASKTVYDVAGNATTRVVSALIDKTLPNISGTDEHPTAWRNTPLSRDYTASDALSGLADSSADASFTLTTSGDSPNAATPVAASRTVTDAAGNSRTRSISAFVDTVKPTIDSNRSGTAGSNGWYTSDVTVTFDCDDALSGLATNGCTGADTLTSSGSVTGTATDHAGNTNADTVTVKIDKADPSITYTLSSNANSAGWHNADVTVTFNCSDATSGVATCPSPMVISTEGTTQVTGTAYDMAGNSSSITPFDVKLDKTKPALNLPANLAFLPDSDSGKVVTYTASASDNYTTPLSAQCDAASGTLFPIGTTTVTCTATDDAGNTGTGSFAVSVKYWTFQGYKQKVLTTSPTATTPAWNTVKAASTVALRFNAFNEADTEVTSTSAVSMTFSSVPCTGGTETPLSSLATTTGGTVFRYDSTGGQFIYNWQTSKSWAGKCYKVTASGGGSSITAYFKVR